MLRTFEHTYAGTTYQITLFPASKGMRILKTLIGLFGPSLASVFGSVAAVTSGTGNAVIEDTAISAAVQLFVDNLDKVEVESVIKDMVNGVLVGGQPINFDMQFAGNYGALLSVLTAIVKENYSSFFGEGGFVNLSAVLSRLPSKPASTPSQS